jgi:hypothetical protein
MGATRPSGSERQRVLDTFTTRYVHGIANEEASWPPGLHRILAKRYGAKGTTLPIVLDGDTVIQGSGAIIDWADEQAQDHARRLTLATH